MKVPSAAEALSIPVRPSTKWHAKANVCQVYEQNPPFFFKKGGFFLYFCLGKRNVRLYIE